MATRLSGNNAAQVAQAMGYTECITKVIGWGFRKCRGLERHAMRRLTAWYNNRVQPWFGTSTGGDKAGGGRTGRIDRSWLFSGVPTSYGWTRAFTIRTECTGHTEQQNRASIPLRTWTPSAQPLIPTAHPPRSHFAHPRVVALLCNGPTSHRQSGYLEKRAKTSGRNWKKRYFVLSGHTITYYVDHKSKSDAKGSFLLTPKRYASWPCSLSTSLPRLARCGQGGQ